jgi:hypothetical protein
MDTYKSGAEALADKQAQVALVAALLTSSLTLRRDECGAWRISWGDNETWVLYVGSGSARGWKSHKRRLGFCRVAQNGDTEGCLRLMALPTPQQSAVIREVLGIRKRGSANQGSYGEKHPLVPIEAPLPTLPLATVSEAESASLVESGIPGQEQPLHQGGTGSGFVGFH